MPDTQTPTDSFEVLRADQGVSVHLLSTDKYKTDCRCWIPVCGFVPRKWRS